MKINKLITFITTAFIACTACLVPITSYADVIWEPIDKFYESHRDEITLAQNRCYAITAETDIYDQPSGDKKGTLKVGDEPSIYYYYTDENNSLWGGFSTNDGNGMLWIKLDGLEIIYDNISFTEEHESEFSPITDQYSDIDLEGNPLYLWAYPESEKNITMPTYPEEWVSYIQYTYTDDNGTWGYIPYIWSNEGWVFLDNPSTDVITAKAEDAAATAPLTEVTEIETTLSEESQSQASISDSPYVETSNNHSFVIAGILAAVAVVVSVALLIIFGRKKK